jgi:hypothetical protein
MNPTKQTRHAQKAARLEWEAYLATHPDQLSPDQLWALWRTIVTEGGVRYEQKIASPN